MKRMAAFGILAAFLIGFTGPASAHFGMVIPSDNMVMQDDARSVTLALSFSHPFEMIGMDLVKPKSFSVTANGQTTDLGDSLEPATVMEHPAWTAAYAVKRPGAYTFCM